MDWKPRKLRRKIQAWQVIEVSEEYWKMVCRKICGNKNCTLLHIWTEDCSKENPQGLGYSQFCRRYKQWSEVAKVENYDKRVPLSGHPNYKGALRRRKS